MISVNGVDVPPLLVVINVVVLVAWVAQWVVFATIASRVRAQLRLSRPKTTTDVDSGSGSKPASSRSPPTTGTSGAPQRKSRSNSYTNNQKATRIKIILIFFTIFFGTIRGIDASAIYSDAWVYVRFLAFHGFGICGFAFLVVYTYQHCVAFYMTHHASLDGAPKWTHYARDGFIILNVVTQVTCVVLLLATRRLLFEGVSRVFYSIYLYAISAALLVFVNAIIREMRRHFNLDDTDDKRTEVIRKIRRFGYGLAALLFVIATINGAFNVATVGSPLLLEESTIFGPRSARRVTPPELQPTFLMIIFTAALQKTLWVNKRVVPTQKKKMSNTSSSTQMASKSSQELEEQRATNTSPTLRPDPYASGSDDTDVVGDAYVDAQGV